MGPMASPERAARPATGTGTTGPDPSGGGGELPDAAVAAGWLDAEEIRLRRLLGALVAAGVGEGGALAGGELAGVSQHPADRGTDTFEREFDTTLAHDVGDELTAVLDARRRLAEGRYGRCERCGIPIGVARLEAVPATRFCLRHEERFELGGPHLEDLAGGEASEAGATFVAAEATADAEQADWALERGGLDPADLLLDDDGPGTDTDDLPVAEEAALTVRLGVDLEAAAEADEFPGESLAPEAGADEFDRDDLDRDELGGDELDGDDAVPDVATVVETQLYPPGRAGGDEESPDDSG